MKLPYMAESLDRDEGTISRRVKKLTEKQVDDLIKLKFGSMVTSLPRKSYVADRVLGQIFGVSGSQVRRLYMERFDQHRHRQQPLIARLR